MNWFAMRYDKLMNGGYTNRPSDLYSPFSREQDMRASADLLLTKYTHERHCGLPVPTQCNRVELEQSRRHEFYAE